MRFTSERRLDDGVLEREFTLGEIPGTLWTPESAAPAPLILMAHNNGLPKGASRLVARARHCAASGYAVATIDAAGCGERPRSAAETQATPSSPDVLPSFVRMTIVGERFSSTPGPRRRSQRAAHHRPGLARNHCHPNGFRARTGRNPLTTPGFRD